MVKDPGGDKWRADKIILGEKYSLLNVLTFTKFPFLYRGSNHAADWAAMNCHLEVLSIFMKMVANGLQMRRITQQRMVI